MKIRLHRCRWHFHVLPAFQVGECDFGRFRGMIVDWLGLTLEVSLEDRYVL